MLDACYHLRDKGLCAALCFSLMVLTTSSRTSKFSERLRACVETLVLHACRSPGMTELPCCSEVFC